MLKLEELCTQVQQIARQAGAFLKEERRKFDRARVEEKGAHNYVSYVDKESEKWLIAQLSALLPEAGFIAEEGSGSLTDENYCWLVDPLDGTSNYIHDLAPYCVSIALRNKEELLIGLVVAILARVALLLAAVRRVRSLVPAVARALVLRAAV